jgi:FkbM family methyltransferase
MSIYSRLKGITYSPVVVKIIKFLRIRTPMRALYYYFARPKDRIKNISFCGISAKFYVPTPLELRMVETPFNSGMGDERKALKKLLETIMPNDVIYDIGANIGIQSIFMAKKTGINGKVIAIEPEDVCFRSLNANIELNTLKNIEAVQIALGSDFSKSQIYSSSATGDYSLLNTANAVSSQKVSIIPGDTLAKEYNFPLPDIVEIDVEGYEYNVIMGLKEALSQDKCRMVFCEIHPHMLPKDISPENCIELLKSYGFCKVEVYKRGNTLHAFLTRANVKNEN